MTTSKEKEKKGMLTHRGVSQPFEQNFILNEKRNNYQPHGSRSPLGRFRKQPSNRNLS